MRPGSALDRAAGERGNSAYFPDRVVPMLPEGLSNGWCSLKPGEERGCLAVHMWIDKTGNKLRHRFERGLMRSAARLTYSRVQAARDGQADELTGPLMEPVIAPLYGAFRALLAARLERGALDLDLPERQVVIGKDGRIERIIPRARLDSHRLIEEFMIAANVSAAETLEQKKTLCMYRVHDEPAAEKVETLRDFLASLGYKLAKGQVLRPRHFTQILEKAASTPHSQLVSEVILRSQAQAVYAPDNRGHFGLALRRYAHFTSPIRRYGDLLVHRGLIASLGLGPDGLSAGATQAHFARLGEHISMTERRADAAERDAEDRFIAAYLAAKVGASFAGRISGVTRFGLFVTLEETGADGLVPISNAALGLLHPRGGPPPADRTRERDCLRIGRQGRGAAGGSRHGDGRPHLRAFGGGRPRTAGKRPRPALSDAGRQPPRRQGQSAALAPLRGDPPGKPSLRFPLDFPLGLLSGARRGNGRARGGLAAMNEIWANFRPVADFAAEFLVQSKHSALLIVRHIGRIQSLDGLVAGNLRRLRLRVARGPHGRIGKRIHGLGECARVRQPCRRRGNSESDHRARAFLSSSPWSSGSPLAASRPTPRMAPSWQ